MALIHRILPVIFCLGLLGAILGLPGRVSATTGPTQFLPASHYKVPSGLKAQFTGQYVLKSVASKARLSGGAMGIEINDRGSLYGVGQFYGYDDQGFQSVWVATLYNFHQASKGQMIIDLVGPTGKPLLGRLFVTRAKTGDLSGQIELTGTRYAIAWHKLPKH